MCFLVFGFEIAPHYVVVLAVLELAISIRLTQTHGDPPASASAGVKDLLTFYNDLEKNLQEGNFFSPTDYRPHFPSPVLP